MKPDPLGLFRHARRLTAAGDVIAVGTSGHTGNHVSVIVWDGETAIFLPGDTSYTEQALIRGEVDGVSPSETDAGATLAAIRQFAQEHPTVYLPTHDPDAATRLHFRSVVPRA